MPAIIGVFELAPVSARLDSPTAAGDGPLSPPEAAGAVAPSDVVSDGVASGVVSSDGLSAVCDGFGEAGFDGVVSSEAQAVPGVVRPPLMSSSTAPLSALTWTR